MLMNNSFYSKTMENVRNRVDVRFATNAKDYQIIVNRSSFVSQKIINISQLFTRLNKY